MLSNEQIEHLYKFCKQHYVAYYDVQIELVDHLASAIEAEMTVREDLSFDAALKVVYESFGTGGFKNIVKENMTALTKKNRRRLFGTLKSLLKWPFAAATISFLLAEFVCYYFFSVKIAFYLTVFCSLLITIPLFISIYKSRKNSTKPLLANSFTGVYLPNHFTTLCVQYFAFLLNFVSFYFNGIYGPSGNFQIFGLILGIVFLFFEVSFLLAFQTNQEYLQKKYPAAF